MPILWDKQNAETKTSESIRKENKRSILIKTLGFKEIPNYRKEGE